MWGWGCTIRWWCTRYSNVVVVHLVMWWCGGGCVCVGHGMVVVVTKSVRVCACARVYVCKRVCVYGMCGVPVPYGSVCDMNNIRLNIQKTICSTTQHNNTSQQHITSTQQCKTTTQ